MVTEVSSLVLHHITQSNKPEVTKNRIDLPLDKNPRVRPIGKGEVLLQINGGTIHQCIKSELKNIGKKFAALLGPEVWNRTVLFDKNDPENLRHQRNLPRAVLAYNVLIFTINGLI